MMRAGGTMIARTCWALGLSAMLWACGGDGSDVLDTDGGPGDAGGSAPDAESCPTGGSGSLAIEVEIDDGASADVRIATSSGSAVGSAVTESATRTLPAGVYEISAHRVRAAGTLLGPAYQGEVQGSAALCVRSGASTAVRVVYTREPGSARLWLTQSNGDGEQVMAFDADQLEVAGAQTPSVSLAPRLNSVGPIRVDGHGRLWVGTSGGTLVAYDTDRLGMTSSAPPDVVLEGSALCGPALPCGPRAIAFDARGALWIALLDRVVMLEPESLEVSGEPDAALTVTSADLHTPDALAFNARGDLWVADADGAILRFDAARLAADIDDEDADVVIFTQQPGPVMIGLGGPSGLAFDADGNLWVGYFGANALVRLTPSELSASVRGLIPSLYVPVSVGALITDLTIDEAGNLWLPGSTGRLFRLDAAQFSATTPEWDVLSSAEIGSVERLTLNTVPGGTFIAP
jgi:streptogramin lyase